MSNANRRSINAQFTRFDRKHPEVYTLFKRYARMLLDAGQRRGSADMILHRLRWETSVGASRRHGARYKLNNIFSSRYARKLAAEDERFARFFTFRRLHSGRDSLAGLLPRKPRRPRMSKSIRMARRRQRALFWTPPARSSRKRAAKAR